MGRYEVDDFNRRRCNKGKLGLNIKLNESRDSLHMAILDTQKYKNLEGVRKLIPHIVFTFFSKVIKNPQSYDWGFTFNL